MKTHRMKSAFFVVPLALTASAGHANLIAYWPFDEGEGPVAADVIGGHDATINGGEWNSEAKVGPFAYEGFGGEEVVCDAAAIPSTDDFTMSWWMIDNHADYGTIMDKSIVGADSGFIMMVRGANEDSPFRFRLGGWQETYGGWGDECRVPSGAYSDGEWVHMTCVFDSETDTASIYVNGELPENGDLNPKTGITYTSGPNNPDAPLYLHGGFENFNGVLDDIAMWDRPLTAEEIAKVYESGPLSLEVPDLNLQVTEIALPSATEVSLTWNSLEGDSYIVKYSTDLLNWDNDLDDGVQADPGDSTTRTYDLSGLSVTGPLFFRIEKP